MSAEDRRGFSPGAQIARGEKEAHVRRSTKAGSVGGKFYPFSHKHVVVDIYNGHLGIFRPTGKKEVSNGVTRIEQAPNDLSTIEDSVSQTLWIVPTVLLVTPQSYERKDLTSMHAALDLIGWWNQFPITEEELKRKQNEVRQFVEDSGYNSVRDILRQEIATNLNLAAGKDSLNRINAKRSEVFAAMAHRAARLRVDKNTTIWFKNATQIFPDLVNLRQDGRKRIKQALKAIRRVVAKKSNGQFIQGVQSLIETIPTVIPVNKVPTAPYVKSVAKTYFIFTQHNEQDPLHDWVFRVLGKEEFEKLSKQTSFKEWVDKYSITPHHSIEALRGRLSEIPTFLDEPLQEGGRRMHEKLEKHWEKILQQTV